MREIRPFLLRPKTKEYIWGGTKLKALWNKQSDTLRIAETWELSEYPDMECEVGEGRYSGLTLAELGEAFPDIYGATLEKFDRFPMLIKLIDAAENLSIQVHPDDEFAKINERGELGKTEMWYILDADEGAGIYYGFNKDLTREELAASINNSTVTSLLNFVPVKKGECYFIEAGTVHAILRGVTVLEIQENSNLTYRVFDYDRIDRDGKPRELHIDKALSVTKLTKTVPQTVKNAQENDTARLLAVTPYFVAEEVAPTSPLTIYNPNSFVTLTVTDGVAEEGGESYRRGDTVFIPARVKATFSGKFSAVTARLP